ncbi:unnamed protein product [Mytilus edulis]|uniref:Uncharacterized protein n=1 Tax=Mytilus edulis TaxID=6550 RepID=A0A8S3SSG5_MYTED|nr:unnamed protein product [Mytilus edulis]
MNLLYTENPGPGKHHCHCKYTAKPVQLDDLDITLIGLILVNCFTLRPAEEQAVRSLRQYKNDYLSHNTNCGIPEPKQERQSYHLDKIFHSATSIDKSSPSADMNFPVNKAVITNDGYVASIDTEESLMNIYKTDGSYVTAIRADGLDFTAVNNSMVAVTRFFCNRIDIWDIHNEQKVKVKSIQLLPSVTASQL